MTPRPDPSFPTHARSHYEVLAHYHSLYDRGLEANQFQPFIYPWGSFGALIVILYLLIPHQNRPWLRKGRLIAWAWMAAFSAYSTVTTRARAMAPAFGLGLVNAWGVVWILTILVINDAQVEFQRIERMEGAFRRGSQEMARPPKATFGQSEESEEKYSATNEDASNSRINPGHKEQLGPAKRRGEFAWQSYPSIPFIERLDWVLDIFCNFKGMGWNWRISSLPPPPKWVQEQLYRNSREPPRHSYRVHAGQTKVYETQREVLIAATKTVAWGYIGLDLLKTISNHDPYFWGLVSSPAPASYPSIFHTYTTLSPILTRMYRLTTSMFLVKYSLQTIFGLAPLFFCGLLGSSLIGARAETWMYPEEWGSYTLVLDRGLAGWWSGWWHQTFQFAFKEPSRKLIEVTGMDKRGALAKGLQLLIAFALSGSLHACGSYTQPGHTRPLLGPMRFFLLQAVGIFLEVVLSRALRRTGIRNYVPKVLMRAFTFVYVHIWFYFTANLLVDDFARGGIWLYEPVPLSLFRGLGFGVKGDGLLCWGWEMVRWVSGEQWWKSGIAF